jgi:hypothetical protein
MIRRLLDAYAEHHGRALTGRSTRARARAAGGSSPRRLGTEA